VSATHDAHGESSHSGGHGHGSRFIQHHYDDARHQFESGKFAIWLFLAQEVLFFSALFVAYTLYRHHHPEIYSYAHKWLQVKFGAINTAVLIFSSLTAAWAVRCAQKNQKTGLIVCIALTIGCACTFLGIKYIEYSHKWREQILFGRYFDPCVSPGGVELITKKNECAGVKSTIEWTRDPKTHEADRLTGKAESGCFEASKIDVEPNEPGIQADCQVKEYNVKFVEKKTTDKDGKEVISEDRVESFARDITMQCPEEALGEGGESEKSEASRPEKKYPCWRTGYQPAVCPDLTDGESRARGVAARPQVGILVEYGDTAERGEEIAIKATCKAPPPPPKPGASAPPPTGSVYGTQMVKKRHIVSEHEEFELESMGPPPEHTNMFLSVYFAMTGLHGIHVLVGVIVFVWLLIRAIKGHFTPDYFGPIDYAALYWHIVDLIWIFLFPLLYLIH